MHQFYTMASITSVTTMDVMRQSRVHYTQLKLYVLILPVLAFFIIPMLCAPHQNCQLGLSIPHYIVKTFGCVRVYVYPATLF